MYLDINELKLKSPCRLLLIGASGSGKTFFLLKLIKYAEYMFTTPPDQIIYCYSVMQPILEDLAKENKIVELHEGFSSDLYESHDPSSHLLLCVDDLMSSDIFKELSDLYTKHSRHKNISVAFLTQVGVYNILDEYLLNHGYIYIYIYIYFFC